MRFVSCLTPLALLAAGCARSDADALGRIGELLVQKAKALPQAGPNGRLVSLPGEAAGDLTRLVETQLRSEPGIGQLAIRVEPADGRVRLTGRVADEEQHNRVLRVAESAAGPGKVVDALDR